MDTAGYEGTFRRVARVYTNDPQSPTENMSFSATIKPPIRVTSRMVFLQGQITERVSKAVEIRAELNKPLKIEPVDYNLDKKVTYRISEIEAGKIYQIMFTSIPSVGNYFQGVLKLKTNYPEKPEIDIYVRGRFLN